GTPVSYGLTEKVSRDSVLAILPIGYSDGYDRRALSSVGQALINGHRCKVMGRVCMNMTIVDVTDIKNVKVGDVVTLIGKQGKEEVTAEDIASKIGTIQYEVLARINPLIERRVVR
ncbi:alanine racemase, partial [Candidatus Uhrbacteria bacterium]|nr:alanine racemase [Candidatus Uhrbacteria bacterium]